MRNPEGWDDEIAGHRMRDAARLMREAACDAELLGEPETAALFRRHARRFNRGADARYPDPRKARP